MVEADDVQLIAAIQRRDATALMALYDRHGRLAFAVAYRVLGDPSAAEEVVQDAFLLVWQRAASFDPARGSAVRAWLLTIVRHRAIDVLRRVSGRPRQTVDIAVAEDLLAVPDAWGEVSGGMDRARVRSAVATLPAEQQHAIELAYFEGLTHREIADRTGTPLGTVKGRLRLGLAKLHGSLVDLAQPIRPPYPTHPTDRGRETAHGRGGPAPSVEEPR